MESKLNEGKLYYTIGLPRSGKTTFCQKWVGGIDISDIDFKLNYDAKSRKSTFTVSPRVHISGDSFRKAISGREYEIKAEPFVFATMDSATRALLSTGHDVIIDETSSTPETIKRYMRIQLDAKPIWFNTSKEECIRRAIDTGKPYLAGPIERIAVQLAYLKENWLLITDRIRQELLARESQDITV